MAIGGLLTLFQVATPALAEGGKPLDGLRGALEPSGLSIEAEYTGELVTAHKGAADGKSYYLDNVNVMLTWDLEKAFGLTGTTFYMNVLGNSGDRPNDAIGTLEVFPTLKSPMAASKSMNLPSRRSLVRQVRFPLAISI